MLNGQILLHDLRMRDVIKWKPKEKNGYEASEMSNKMLVSYGKCERPRAYRESIC